MYTVIPTEQFEKDVKLRQGSPMDIGLFIM